jgi:hypothetical protein
MICQDEHGGLRNMPDIFDDAMRATDPPGSAPPPQPVDPALTAAQDEATGRIMGVALGGDKIFNFFEFLLLFLIMLGVAAAALIWQLFFGDDDEPPHSGIPTEEEHHQFSKVPSFTPGVPYVVVVPAERLKGA